MKKSPTLLMKELKAIEAEIASIHKTDLENSFVPVDYEYKPKFTNDYSYEDNRSKIKELQEREAQIRSILSVFNITTKVIGYDLMISEALVRLAQLKNEIKVLTTLASNSKLRSKSNYSYGNPDIIMTCYDNKKVKEDLKVLQNELSELQVAVDKMNLNSSVDC